MILEKTILPKKAWHNRGPPQQTYFFRINIAYEKNWKYLKKTEKWNMFKKKRKNEQNKPHI